MNRLNRTRLVAAVLAGTLVGATAMTGAYARAQDGERMVNRMAERLELSEEQVAGVRAVIDRHTDARRELSDRMRQRQADVRALTEGESLDEEALRAAADAQADVMADRIVLRATVRSEIRAVLDPEQREAFDAMQSERRGSRGGKWRR